jgi:hypothetical protein
MTSKIILLVFIIFLNCISYSQEKNNIKKEVQGKYFSKKEYFPKSLPDSKKMKEELPFPVFEENHVLVDLYWKAWELAYKNFYEPAPNSGYVSQFIDAAFNKNIFLWDSGFMTMFCNFAYPIVPGIGTLDNFYIKQHEDGEICREINRTTGLDYGEWINKEATTLFSRWGWGGKNGINLVSYIDREIPKPNPVLTLDALNHPILAWAELESYSLTGDITRLEKIYDPLVMYYKSLKKYLCQGNGLYITDWASMDNSPRNVFLEGGGVGIDISSEMVLFAGNLSEIANLIGKKKDAKYFLKESKELSDKINKLMWDKDKKFYFDLTTDNKKVYIKTVAAFWTLLAGVTSKEQALSLKEELENPKTFGRLHPVPTCSADAQGYDSLGGYWKGAVWAPTNTMVIRGLERYGYSDLAREIALKHLYAVAEIYKKTGTIWENYQPDVIEQGKFNGKYIKKDFVGWSGLAPILYFIEYGIGIKANAAKNEIVWKINTDKKCGIEKFRFNGRMINLMAEPFSEKRIKISILSDSSFKLKIIYKDKKTDYKVKKGKKEFWI